ncbi:MAG: hypothetical protein KDI63_01445 [Gammaproteobacteria bacterium]|nr:hypothetical protein [Gammaproteobacteria bacterium]
MISKIRCVPSPYRKSGDALAADLRSQRIALVLMHQPDGSVLNYVLGACERLQACLDVLTDLPIQQVAQAIGAAWGIAAIPWQVMPIAGAGIDALIDYSRQEHGLLFFVSGTGDRDAQRLRREWLSREYRVNTPWVVVENRPPDELAASRPL